MNLDQLYNHPSFPFLDFKENDLVFLLLEMFWVELFRSCIDNSEKITDWKPLYPAERDGSPILVMANELNNRALRIHLRINDQKRPLYKRHPPEMSEKYFLPFDFWLNDIFDSTGEKKFHGLVLSTDMSPSAIDLAKSAISFFCKDEYSPEKMQNAIEEYYKILDEKGYHWE